MHERLWRPVGASEHGGPACFVLRPCGSLLYPNAEAIHDEALRLALALGMPVVLDLSAAPFLDADGAEAIRDLTAACGAAGMPLVFAEAASSVLEKLTAAGVVSGLAFPTADEACINAVAKWKPVLPVAPAAPSTPPG